jgi:hypothetical protein
MFTRKHRLVLIRGLLSLVVAVAIGASAQALAADDAFEPDDALAQPKRCIPMA